MNKILKLGVIVSIAVGVLSIDGEVFAVSRPSQAQIAVKSSTVTRAVSSVQAVSKPSVNNIEYNIDKDLTIAGVASIPKEYAVNFIKSSAPDAKLNCSVEKIVDYYYHEAQKEGIRGDVALVQALVETGFFKYGGSVNYRQNNFCGLGTTSSAVRGASFPTPEIGVRAHIQHLVVYSSKNDPKERIVDPRFDMVKKLPHLYGTSHKWIELSGRWAADKGYGVKVLTVYARMKDYAVKTGYKESKALTKEPAKTSKQQRPLQERIDDILRGN